MSPQTTNNKKQRGVIMPKKDIIKASEYCGYELAQKDQFYSQKYLDKTIAMVNSMTERHSKVLQVRMDLKYPKEITSDGSNKDFQRTMENLMKELSRKGYDPQFIARREQRESKNPHYHLVIQVDGNKKRDRTSLIESAEHHWSQTLGLTQQEVHENRLVFPCNYNPQNEPLPNGYMLNRNAVDFQDRKNEAVRQLSYLAKKEPEDITESHTRKFFSSQFQKDYAIAKEKKRKWMERHYGENDSPCEFK